MFNLEPMYATAQVRRIDAAAIALQGDNGYALMEQAGYFAWRTLVRAWPQLRSVCILAGPGNNGGDALVMGRLALQQGLAIKLHALSEPELWTGAAEQAWKAFEEAGGCLAKDAPAVADVVVDGLFGTGLGRPLSGKAQQWVEWINQSRSAVTGVLALDVPSGLHADSGQALGLAVQADHTVSFVARKLGHDLGDAIDACGELHFSDLGVPASKVEDEPPLAWRVHGWQHPPRRPSTHKGGCGQVLLIAGEGAFAGAGRFAAAGALRAGAGKVSHCVDEPGKQAQDWAEVMCPPRSKLESLLRQADVLCVGPGLGRDPESQQRLPPPSAAHLPQVWDADALWWLAQQPQRARGLSMVMTPHPGEAATLLGLSTAQVQADRMHALETLVDTYQCVVVLKGARTLVGAPGLTPRCIPQGNPAMATGGMGDILAGVISGLIAQGLEAVDAATAGAYLVGRAADRAAPSHGVALLPRDLLMRGELWN